VLKDRIAGDSAEAMVSVLYEALHDGVRRQKRMQVPSECNGWMVYVPSEDVADLQEVWQGQMQAARRHIEKQFKADGKNRRAPRLCFHAGAPGSTCSASSTTEEPFPPNTAGTCSSSSDEANEAKV
jgi:hypothetical protein